MNLAEAITAHGKKLGPFGTAVLAFVVSNPDCTYDQIAEGLDMGRSTVIKYIHQLESLSLAARHTQKNDKGLNLSTSIKSGVYLIEPSVQQVDTAEQRAPINTGVQQLDTDKTGCPPEIHRKSAPLHPHKDILNTNTLSAKKQQRGARAQTPAKPKSEKDPRTNWPAIVAFRDVTKKNPKLEKYDKVIEILGNHPNIPKMRECWEEWTDRGYNDRSLKWLTEWYVSGIPERSFAVINGGGNGSNQQSSSKSTKPSLTDRAREYEDYYGPRNAQAYAG